MTARRAALLAGCGVLSVGLSACVSTERESAKIGRENAATERATLAAERAHAAHAHAHAHGKASHHG